MQKSVLENFFPAIKEKITSADRKQKMVKYLMFYAKSADILPASRRLFYDLVAEIEALDASNFKENSVDENDNTGFSNISNCHSTSSNHSNKKEPADNSNSKECKKQQAAPNAGGQASEALGSAKTQRESPRHENGTSEEQKAPKGEEHNAEEEDEEEEYELDGQEEEEFIEEEEDDDEDEEDEEGQEEYDDEEQQKLDEEFEEQYMGEDGD